MHLIHALWYGPLHVTRMCVWCVYQFWEYELYRKNPKYKKACVQEDIQLQTHAS